EARLGNVLTTRGAAFAADRHLGRAQELWERAAASLSAQALEAFWQHPARAGLRRPAVGAVRREEPAQVERLRHLLAINKRLNSALTTPQVLGLTMDAAIELTSAERGFLILKERPGQPDGALDVAVA